MAEKVEVDLIVRAAESAKTVGEVRKSLEDIQSAALQVGEGSKEFDKLTSAAGKLKAQIKDVKERVAALDPEKKFAAIGKVASGIANGFQAAQGAMALFGTESEDVQKTLLKVQAAMAFANGIQGVMELGKAFKALQVILMTNPIFLIATIIAGIGAAVVALKDKFKPLGDAVDFIADLIKQAIKPLTDFIKLFDDGTDAIKQQIEAYKSINDTINKRYDNEIRLAKAAGKETDEIEKKKLEAVINRAKTEAKLIFLLRSINGELSDEQKKRITEIQDTITDALVRIKEMDLLAQKERTDNAKKYSEERKKIHEDETARVFELMQILDQKQKENSISVIQTKQTEAIESQGLTMATSDYGITTERNTEEEKARIRQEFAKSHIDLEMRTVQAISSIGALVFAAQLNHAKGNEAKMKQIKRRQFNFEKGVAATQAAISTVVAIQKDLEKGFPVGTALAVLDGIIGAANVAAILAKKFPESGNADTSTPSVSTPNTGDLTNQAQGVPSINSPSANPSTQTAGLPTTPVVKAYVVESEISDTQRRVKSIQERATI